jgi:hypothetical protein
MKGKGKNAKANITDMKVFDFLKHFY